MRMNILSKGDALQPASTLKQLVDAPQNGLFQIIHGDVTWYFDFLNGRLRYSGHSLQTFNVVESYLQELGYGSAIEPSRSLFRELNGEGLTSGNVAQMAWTHDFVHQLEFKGILSWNQANILNNQLSRDSLESALWLTAGTGTWVTDASASYKTYMTEWNGANFKILVKMLLKRLQTWQTLAPYIRSPYQRPRYTNPARIREVVPGGALPMPTLELLKKLMKGASLRQLAQILKQDELKLAQLLHPYAKQGILKFQMPEAPFNQLPLIPILVERAVVPPPPPVSREQEQGPVPNLYRAMTPSLAIRPSQNRQKHYKIVCIDDSATMLDTLQQYLSDDCFEVTTLDNPMQSVSTMFSSRPDLVLMDVSMPGINGNRLCQILKRSSAFKTTPIIMVSSNAGVLDQAKAKAMGASDYLKKPFSKEDLLQLVDQYLHFSQPSG